MSSKTEIAITDNPVGGTVKIIGVGTDRMRVEFDEAVVNRVKLTGSLFAEKRGDKVVEDLAYVRRSDFDFNKGVTPATANKLITILLNYVESMWDEDWAKDARLGGEIEYLLSRIEIGEVKVKELRAQLDEVETTLESNRAKLAELTS